MLKRSPRFVKHLTYGSAGLLTCSISRDTFPGHSALPVAQTDASICGTYSCGTVQDSNLIPLTDGKSAAKLHIIFHLAKKTSNFRAFARLRNGRNIVCYDYTLYKRRPDLLNCKPGSSQLSLQKTKHWVVVIYLMGRLIIIFSVSSLTCCDCKSRLNLWVNLPQRLNVSVLLSPVYVALYMWLGVHCPVFAFRL